MRQAGIKVWVLTGDKVETAINIGHSSGLLDYQMKLFYVVLTTFDENYNVLERLEQHLVEMN